MSKLTHGPLDLENIYFLGSGLPATNSRKSERLFCTAGCWDIFFHLSSSSPVIISASFDIHSNTKMIFKTKVLKTDSFFNIEIAL